MNVGEWIQKRALLHPESLFLRDGNKIYNNRQFNERVKSTVLAMGQLGVGQGDRIAVLMSNCSEFLEIFFACARMGAIIVPLNFRLTVPELHYILMDAEPCVLIYTDEFASKVHELKTAYPVQPNYLHYNNVILDFPAFSETRDQNLEMESPRLINLKDPLSIMYTAGTTGNPKGAVLTHENILFGAIHSLLGYGIDRTYKSLVVAPLFHIGALAASVTPIIYAGGSIIISSFYNPSEILKKISEEKINYMFAIPVMYQLMAESENWRDADLSHVYFFISGGAPISLAVIKKYQEEKGVGFVQGYAMTETGRLTSLDLEDAIRKAGSVGKEVFHVNLRIVDEEGKDVSMGEPGEIIVQGPNVFSGYWRKPEETKAAIDEGWFHTGDLGRRDEEGYIYIIGRKDELIISSGQNIYPAEVERALESIPEVREAAVVSKIDSKRGEVVVAFVILHDGIQTTGSALLTALHGKIASYKMPKKVIFVDKFPRNQAGKVLKRILKEHLECR
jgi:fatty-acyl-CoA synthase